MKRFCMLIVATVCATSSCDRAAPADSTSPDFLTAADRAKWMRDRLIVDPPSAMTDAHFFERDAHHGGGHSGPSYTTRFFSGKILIAPADAAKWSAATRPGQRPPGNPLNSTAAWGMSQAEFDAATWHEPAPLFGKPTGGYMAIAGDGSAIFFHLVY